MQSTPIRLHSAHARSLARRLLGGAGMASLVAYRDCPEASVAVLAHGLNHRGQIVIAVDPADMSDLSEAEMEGRLDVHREAAEPQFRIAASSVHLLATVTWLDDAGVAQCFAADGLPADVMMAIRADRVRVGVCRGDRVVVHCGYGVVPLPMNAVVGGAEVFPGRADELLAHDVVAGAGADGLGAIVRSVESGRIAGSVLTTRPTARHSPCAIGRVLCVDVDRHGLTLMRVGTETTEVVFAEFDEPVAGPDELSRAVAAVLCRSCP